MSVQQCQSSRDLGGLLGSAVAFCRWFAQTARPGCRGCESPSKPIRPGYGGQQLGVGGRKGVERSVPTLVVPHRSANFDRLFGQGVVMLAAARAVRYRSLAALEIWAGR